MHTYKKASREKYKHQNKESEKFIEKQMQELNKMKLYLQRMTDLSKVLDELYIDEEERTITCSHENLVAHASLLNSKSELKLNEKLLKIVTDNYKEDLVSLYIDRKNNIKEKYLHESGN